MIPFGSIFVKFVYNRSTLAKEPYIHKMFTGTSNPILPLADTAPSRPAHLRHSNCRVLLHLLQAHGTCSKADLVRASGLSAPTVSSAIAQMEAQGLIETLGEGASA